MEVQNENEGNSNSLRNKNTNDNTNSSNDDNSKNANRKNVNSRNRNHYGRNRNGNGRGFGSNNDNSNGNNNYRNTNKNRRNHRKNNNWSKKNENRNNTNSEEEDDDDEEGELATIQTVVIPVQPILVMCPFKDCSQDEAPFMNPQNLQTHLEMNHNLCIKNIEHAIPFIEKYLCYWIEKMEENENSLEEFGYKKNDSNNVYIIPNSNYENEDKQIREKYQREKLNEMLAIQDTERKESNKSRKCLFCKKVYLSRADYFHHMYIDHNFNIGLPDNIVNIDEFIHILQTKLNSLQCLYCEKIFKASAVLRKHMRKKKHYKINPKNHIYDKFYIINYLEPGKNWENYENDRYYSDEDKDNEWDDWDDEIEDEPTMCLFDEYVASSTKGALEHMKIEHNFDFKTIKEENDLDFYQCIMLINYIRRQTSLLKCYSCLEGFESIDELSSHMKEKEHYSVLPSKDANNGWNNVNYMIPTYDDDPLLHGFNEFSDEIEEVEMENDDFSKQFVTAEKMLIDDEIKNKNIIKKDINKIKIIK